MIDQNYRGKCEKIYGFSFIVLALFVLLLFINNHSALFISDYFYFPLLFVICGMVVIAANKKIRIDYLNCAIVILLMLLLINSLVYIDEVDRGTALSYAVWFATLFFVPNIIPNRKSIEVLLKSFIAGALICSIMIFVFQVPYGETHRYTIKFLNNEIIDTNYLGCFLWLGFTFCLFYLLRNICLTNSIKLLLLQIVLSCVVLFAIILTGSRAAYLCSAMTIVGAFLQIRKKHTKTKTLLMLFAFIIIAGVVVIFMANALPESISSRFGLSSLKDNSNKQRLEHWLFGLKAFLLHPFGYGAMHTKHILDKYVGHPSDAHNTYLTFLLQFGIVGGIIFILLFVRLFKPFLKSKSPFWSMFILSFLLNGLIIANHLGVPFWMTIIILYYLGKKDLLEYYTGLN